MTKALNIPPITAKRQNCIFSIRLHRGGTWRGYADEGLDEGAGGGGDGDCSDVAVAGERHPGHEAVLNFYKAKSGCINGADMI